MSDLATFLRARIALARAERGCGGVGEYASCDDMSNLVESLLTWLEAVAELHRPVTNAFGDLECAVCWSGREGFVEAQAPDRWPCQTLRLAAAPFAATPGYDDAWRPA